MKVRINYSVEIDDQERRAIACHLGKEGIATRTDIIALFQFQGRRRAEEIISQGFEKLAKQYQARAKRPEPEKTAKPRII